MLRVNGQRWAFTLLEVIATLAVISILAGAVVPSVVAAYSRRDIERTAVILSTLSASVTAMKASGVARYPYRISHLGSPIASTDTTSCSGVAPTTLSLYAGQAANWGINPAGPFFHRTIPVTGFPTPLGVVEDIMVRTTNNTTAGLLPLVIRNVRIDDADELNAIVDGDADNANGSNTLGKLIWAVPVNGLVDIKYNITAANSC